jgi:putative NADH-flavin reductase
VVAQAVARGRGVTAFVRDASDVAWAEVVAVVEGDARDADAVRTALSGADAAISVLSLAAPDREPEHSEATRAVLDAAEREGVRRIVVTANNDVFTDDELTGEYAAMGREHRRNRDALRASRLDWTMGAGPWVTDDPPVGRYEVVLDGKAPGRRLPSADFATFALDALERDDWIGHVVGVSGVPTDRQPASSGDGPATSAG